MRVILFSPYYSFTKENYSFYRASIPYNLLYISNYIRQYGIDNNLYDLCSFDESEVQYIGNKIRCGLADSDILKILNHHNPSIVGISAMFSIFHEDIIELTNLIHKFNPLIRVVVGGNHASCFPERLLSEGVDQVVIGEGERAFLDICKGNTEPIVKAKMFTNLDELPFPVFPEKSFNKYIEVHNPFIMGKRVTGIITSRGCPNDCIYCTVNGVWQRSWRGRSPENVVSEMEYMINKHDIDEFHFLDDNVSVDKERWEGILDLMIERKLNIHWATPMAYWTIDERILNKMKKAGCYRLSFGIESGDPETRKFIGKKYPLERAKEIIDYANKIGLWTISTNIIGFPYETGDQIQNTLNFAKSSNVDFACFFNLIPHAQSRVYPFFLKENLIDENADIMSIMNEGGCDTKYFKKAQLKELQQACYKEFINNKIKFYLLHPWVILRKIYSWSSFLYVLRLVRLGFSMAVRSIKNKVSTTSKDFIYGKRQYV